MRVQRSIPLYRQIVEKLREDIFYRLRPGDELPGDNELSRTLKVSPLTVREAMSVLGEEGLLERCVGSGTRIAKPRIGRHQVIAVLIDKDLTHPRFPMHFLPIYEHIRRAFEKSGLRVQLYTGRLDPNDFPKKISSKNLLDDLKSERIAAVVNLVGYPEQKHLDDAAARHIPWIYFGRTGNAPIKITSDMEATLDALIEKFAAHGKSRAALIGWQGFWDTNLRDAERRSWFEAAVAKHGMSTRQEWIWMNLYPGLNGAGWSQFQTMWTSQSDKPDAIIFMDDLLFLDAIPALERIGRNIPHELEIGVCTFRAKQIAGHIPVVVAEVCPQSLSRTVLKQVIAVLESGEVIPSQQIIPADVKVYEEDKFPFDSDDFSDNPVQEPIEQLT